MSIASAKETAERAARIARIVREHPNKSGVEVWGHIGELLATVETLAWQVRNLPDEETER